jgi:hypothetical protein
MRKIVTAAVCGFVLMGASAMAQMPAEFLDITHVQVRSDKGKEFEDAIKKLADVNRRYKGDRWIALTTEYGDFGQYSFCCCLRRPAPSSGVQRTACRVGWQDKRPTLF